MELVLVVLAAALVVLPFGGVGSGSKPTLKAREWAQASRVGDALTYLALVDGAFLSDTI